MTPKTYFSYRMIPSKLAFLFLDPLQGLYGVYLVLILTSFDLSVNEAGFIAGIRCIVAFLLTPLLGWAADYMKRPDIVFMILGATIIVTILPLPWIAKALSSTHLEPFNSSLFYVMLFLTCMSTTCINPMRGFIDSFVMKVISASNTNDSFASQSLFGAIGTMAMNPLCGLLLDWYNPKSLPKFSGTIFFIVAISVVITPVGYVLAQQSNEGNNIQKQEEKSMIVAFREVFINVNNMMYLMSIFIIGLTGTGFNTYYFKLMKDKMNSKDIFMGLSYGAAGLGEIFIFLNGETIMNEIGNPIHGLIISLIAQALRFLLSAVTTNAWLMIPVQLLNGIIFALMYMSAAKYTYQIADEKIYNTVFLIEVNCLLNAGGFVSAFLGGSIYENYGGSVLFLGFCDSLWVILMLVYFVIPDICETSFKHKSDA